MYFRQWKKTVFEINPKNRGKKHTKNNKKNIIFKNPRKTTEQKTPILRFGQKSAKLRNNNFWKIEKNIFLTTIDLVCWSHNNQKIGT